MERILITGHTGMLGRNIVHTFQQHIDKYPLFGVSRQNKLGIDTIEEYQGDLTDDKFISEVLSIVDPAIIINTAALTDLNYCETHVYEAHRLHVKLSRRLAEQKNARIIYISTDSVFNGDADISFKEQDPTYPLNYYAHSKLEGEWATLRANPNALIVRTNIFGFKVPAGGSLAEWALTSFEEGKSINGYSDVFFNPLYVGQVAELLLKILRTAMKGVLHMGSTKSISKFEFLRLLATTFGYEEDLVIESHAPKDGTLRRPKNTTLNIDSLNNALNENPSVTYGLKMFKSDISKLYGNN